MGTVITGQPPIRQRRLPLSRGNLFQGIKKLTLAAEAAGKRIYRLSIGQPDGPAFFCAREAAATAVLSGLTSMHEYQDNGSAGVPDFARRFVQCHVKRNLSGFSPEQIAYLPIPGIKPMLPLVPLACGASELQGLRVATMTDPGYPTPATWCKKLPGIEHFPINLFPGNNFLFNSDNITDVLQEGGLLMLNYPHNPSGKAANVEWLRELCGICEMMGVRIFNDAAYAVLAHNQTHTTLADVAVDFPNLSWLEAYSASKAGNFTGWRVGAMVGSPDFVADLASVKEDTDSGFAAPLAAGVIELFENHSHLIDEGRETYRSRITSLTHVLEHAGMELAVAPDAGFFTLWKLPKRAFGVEITDAEQFNGLMIEQTGIVGVHFHPYIRYAVTGDVDAMLPGITEGFDKAKISNR